MILVECVCGNGGHGNEDRECDCVLFSRRDLHELTVYAEGLRVLLTHRRLPAGAFGVFHDVVLEHRGRASMDGEDGRRQRRELTELFDRRLQTLIEAAARASAPVSWPPRSYRH